MKEKDNPNDVILVDDSYYDEVDGKIENSNSSRLNNIEHDDVRWSRIK